MNLSYVIVTHNRREPLLGTLERLHRDTPLPADQWEAWVVDNASTDGTAGAVRVRFPRVRLIERVENEGVAARNHAFHRAAGRYIVLLDDDSYPVGDAVIRSMKYLDYHPDTAALVGRVLLPDGSLEACALPSVMLSGAVCIRKSVLEEVGGFREEFFRKAGEYDLSFRIWQAGYAIERREEVVYRHDKVTTGRSSALAHRMDLRNNLILVDRYLPRSMRRVYRRDWLRRYALLARSAGEHDAVRDALAEARRWGRWEMATGRQTLRKDVLETIFEWDKQRDEVAEWAWRHGVRRVVIADYGKNLYATYRACRLAGLNIAAVADNQPAFRDTRYRSVAILPDTAALADPPDGVVLSNLNPAQIDRRIETLRRHFAGPILRLWRPTAMAPTPSPGANLQHAEALQQ